VNEQTPSAGDTTSAEPTTAPPVIKTVPTANPNRTKAPTRQEVNR
jgi:hypothetical protein